MGMDGMNFKREVAGMRLLEGALTVEIYNGLRAAVGWSPYSVEQAQRALAGSVFHLVGFSQGEAVGMGRLIGDGIYYLLVDVVVAPAHRGKGLGGAIVKGLIAHAREGLLPGERCALTLIAAEGREGFYEKLGFAKLPNANGGHGMQLFLKGAEGL